MTKTIYLWAAAHPISNDQLADLSKTGTVRYLQTIDPDLYSKLTNLTLNSNLYALAQRLIDGTSDDDYYNWIIVQPAGSPAFQFVLGNHTRRVWYAHSDRVSKDIPQDDGSVKKISVFKHAGWIKF